MTAAMRPMLLCLLSVCVRSDGRPQKSNPSILGPLETAINSLEQQGSPVNTKQAKSPVQNLEEKAACSTYNGDCMTCATATGCDYYAGSGKCCGGGIWSWTSQCTAEDYQGTKISWMNGNTDLCNHLSGDDGNYQCSPATKFECPHCRYMRKSRKCADLVAPGTEYLEDIESFPIRVATAAHGVPSEIQGVFWLTRQGLSSSLVSFAPGNDGGGTGVLDDRGTGIVKVGWSDRTWSFSDVGNNMDKAEKVDLQYKFIFKNALDESSRYQPVKAEIHPIAAKYGVTLGGWAADLGIVEFTMKLLNPICDPKWRDNHMDHEALFDSTSPLCKPDPNEEFPLGYEDFHTDEQPTHVWQRETSGALFKWGTGLDDLSEANYKAVQVIDGEGRILPAYWKWVEFCGDTTKGTNTPMTSGEDNTTPGVFHYHEIDNSMPPSEDCPAPGS